MGDPSSRIRQQEARKLAELICPLQGRWGSWIIQGLPECGVERVFAELVEQIRTKSDTTSEILLAEMDLSMYWTGSVSRCVSAILAELPPLSCKAEQDDWSESSLDTLLTEVRDKVIRLAEKDRRIIFVLDHFDSLLKFAKTDDVQHLLNMFQSLCYNPKYHAANIVRCYRDIEDICQAANYSDYYKVFGSNHYRVAGVSPEALSEAIKEMYPRLGDSKVRQVQDWSAGYPEHAEVIIRFIDGDDSACERQALDALSLPFLEWVNCMTPGEVDVLNAIRNGSPLGPEHFFAGRKLRRKGILKEQGGEFSIASPLFALFLSDRKGKVDEKTMVCVRQSGKLNPVHRRLLDELFQGYYYIEWRLMQTPLPGDATVYLVTGEDHEGVPYRPCIVKIDSNQRSALEVERLETARSMLGSLVPNLLRQRTVGNQEAIVLEYATADNRDFTVSQFADFYRNHSAEEIGTLLCRTLGYALFPLYRSQTVKSKPAKQLYFLPRLHQGEYERIADIVKTSQFYQASNDSVQLPGSKSSLPNPGNYLRPSSENDVDSAYVRFFVSPRDVGLCFAHGDLNPRNFLVDGIGNVHLIDFCEMKPEGARFLDFVRLEAEIKFKLTEVTDSSLEPLLALESLLVEINQEYQMEKLKRLPLEKEALKMLHAVVALRQTARAICEATVSDLQFDTEYKLGLLAQTLRISLYQDYLSELQQEFAVLSSALIVQQLEDALCP